MSDAAHQRPWKISDVIMFPGFAVAIALEWIWPSEIVPVHWIAPIPVGLFTVLVGFKLISLTKEQMAASSQPSLPGTPTTKLITDGPFGFSRNPNYLGAILIALGAGVAVNSLWFLAVAILCAVTLEIWMIRPEERYLRREFGSEYAEYAARVRRWL